MFRRLFLTYLLLVIATVALMGLLTYQRAEEDFYSLVREVGRGGMGSVWEALDLELDAPCALKFILEHIASNPDLRKRFLREARAVAQLHSPHVVSVRGVGEHEGALYTAMELLRGETLEDRLARERVLDPLTVFKIVQQVASVRVRDDVFMKDL